MKVRFGVAVGGGTSAPVDELGPILDALDRLGFDSIWLPETFLTGSLDPVVALSFAAARVSRLKLGTHLVAPGRNVVRLARQCAQLDRLSGGRLLLTFVLGLDEPAERAAQRVPPGDRGEWFEEHLPALRELWAGGTTGDGVRLVSLPVQRPLEIWFGGKARRALERAGRLADGWLAGAVTIEEAVAGKAVVEHAAAEAGRVISPEHFGINLTYALDEPDPAAVAALAARRRPGVDTRDLVAVGVPALRTLVGRWVDAGFTKFTVRPLVAPSDASGWDDELSRLADALLDLTT
jgi:probable F420-dependent oxidoreductase